MEIILDSGSFDTIFDANDCIEYINKVVQGLDLDIEVRHNGQSDDCPTWQSPFIHQLLSILSDGWSNGKSVRQMIRFLAGSAVLRDVRFLI